MANSKFSCASCRNQTFKGKTNMGSYKDFIGSVCSKCGTTVTEAHIKAFVIKIAKDSFGKK